MKELSLVVLFFFSLICQAKSTGPGSNGFIENMGQILTTTGEKDDRIKFLANPSQGLNIQIKNSGISFDTYAFEEASNQYAFHRLDLQFLNVNNQSKLIATEKNEELINTVRGSEKHENIRVYNRIAYENLYNGIDLVARSSEKGFKYDLVLESGSDISQILLEYRGFDSYEAASNCINFNLSGRSLTEHIPLSWLSESGEEIEVVYRIIEEETDRLIIGFEVCDDSNLGQSMVIDPEVYYEWASFYGGSLDDSANDIATDSLGNIFVVGTTQSIEMIASAGSYQSTYSANTDAYLVKFNQHGLRHWSTYYGGSGFDEGLGVCVDRFEQVYIVGKTNSTDSIGTSESYQDSLQGGWDGFIARFNRLGEYRWDTYLGGELDDEISACETVSGGIVHALGTTVNQDLLEGNDFDISIPHSGGRDAFLIEFNILGEIERGTYLGIDGDEIGSDLAVSLWKEIYVALNSQGGTSLPYPNAENPVPFGESDGLVYKLDSLYQVEWASFIGSEGEDVLSGITSCPEQGHFFVSGNTLDDIEGVETYTDLSSLQGESDGFLGRYEDTGFNEWFTYVGGVENDFVLDLDSDGDSALFVLGHTGSLENIALVGDDIANATDLNGAQDAFISSYDLDSGEKIWGQYFGGEGTETSSGIDVYGSSAIFFVGNTNDQDSLSFSFGEEPQPHQSAFGGGLADGFMARLTTSRTTIPYAICSGSNNWGYGGGHEDPVICLGDSIILSVGGGCLAPGAEWVWYADSCGGTDNFIGEGNEIWVSPDSTSTYYVRGEDIDKYTGCVSTNVIVEQPIEIEAFLTDSICAGTTLEFWAEGGLTYTWDGPDTLFFEGANPVIDTATFEYVGWYEVTGMGLACTDIDSVELTTLYPSPFIDADITNPTCVGLSDGSIVVNEPDTTITLFEWLDIGGDTLFRGSLSEGFYPYQAENTFGCSISSGFQLNDPSSPFDSLEVTADTCNRKVGSAMAYLSSNWEDQFTIAWSTGADTNTVSISNLGAGNYSVQAFNQFGCLFEESFVVGNFGDFDTEIGPDSVFLTFDESTTFEVINTPQQENPTFNWSPAEGLSCSDCANPIVDPDVSTTYFLTVSSELGCTAFDTVFVEREIPPPSSFIPTVFSPNSDGLNDELCVLGNRILEIDFTVYNRWGEEVFATNNMENCWDGNHNGQPVNGALIYTFKAVLEEGETIEESGNIQILR